MTRAYIAVRKTYAEAMTRATSDAQQLEFQHRVTRLRRQSELVDVTDLGAVVHAIAAVHVEQQAANAYVAAQIAAAQL